LIKLGIAIGAQHEGAVHSATRQALSDGATSDEVLHAAILAITTIGWPSAYAAMTWINDVLSQAVAVNRPVAHVCGFRPAIAPCRE
jgi:alkylhydroperoxidase/carboxymuconolactone decarboxylase family protein YurZ